MKILVLHSIIFISSSSKRNCRVELMLIRIRWWIWHIVWNWIRNEWRNWRKNTRSSKRRNKRKWWNSEWVELRFSVYITNMYNATFLYASFRWYFQRLRSENRLLRQRVELLEAESSELADRLVRGQVSRAEEEETSFVLQRELATLRHSHLDTLHMLENAQEEIKMLSMVITTQNVSDIEYIFLI